MINICSKSIIKIYEYGDLENHRTIFEQLFVRVKKMNSKHILEDDMNFSRIRNQFSVVLTILCLLVIGVGNGFAQQAVTGSADGTVLAAITLAATENLEFGNIFQGVPKTVPRTATGADTTAAIFSVTGQPEAGVTAQLVLPEYLSSSGGAQMLISFGTTDMAIDTTNAETPATVAAGDGWVDQNPRSFPAAMQIGGAPATATTLIFLGGKVTPSLYQPAGTYTGDIILSVSYNGN